MIRSGISHRDRQGTKHPHRFPDMNLPITSLDPSSNRLQFMERLSHDMSSLLASISGYASLVADPNSFESEINLEACGKIIVKQASRLQRMVTDAMTITRITENKLDLALTPILLGTLLQATIAEASEQNGREITFQDESEGRRVTADPLRLCEAFDKLLDNALKFSDPSTSIEVNYRLNETSGCAEIWLEDHGIGIAEADLPRLFQPFGRIYSEKTWAIPGNGLGLYIAGEIVARHHGKITVQSQPNQGAVFIINLPL
jgi:signal transduction histidine kinase